MKKPICSFEDFAKTDLRVGQVTAAEKVEGSEKLIALTVDLGEDWGTVEILTGLQAFYDPSDFVNNKYVFIVNLEPRKMMGRMSNGMFLAADVAEKPVPLQMPDVTPNGSSVI